MNPVRVLSVRLQATRHELDAMVNRHILLPPSSILEQYLLLYCISMLFGMFLMNIQQSVADSNHNQGFLRAALPVSIFLFPFSARNDRCNHGRMVCFASLLDRVGILDIMVGDNHRNQDANTPGNSFFSNYLLVI